MNIRRQHDGITWKSGLIKISPSLSSQDILRPREIFELSGRVDVHKSIISTDVALLTLYWMKWWSTLYWIKSDGRLLYWIKCRHCRLLYSRSPRPFHTQWPPASLEVEAVQTLIFSKVLASLYHQTTITTISLYHRITISLYHHTTILPLYTTYGWYHHHLYW